MTLEEANKEIQELKSSLKKMEDIMFGIGNDPRFQAKVRSFVVGDEHATGKPRLINKNGKIYKLDIV